MLKLKELLFLKNIKGFGKKTIYMRYFNDVQSVDGIEPLKDIVRCKDKHITDEELLRAEQKAEELVEQINRNKELEAITVFDKLYPKQLNVMKLDRPLVLYVKGNVEALKEQNIAVIGTRKPSEWSAIVEDRLVKKIMELSERVIISGLALGCDKIAHETTVKEKRKTVAVLPSGVNVITPASHKKLAKAILETGGCLVSEYAPNDKAYKTTYVERDALVAALSDIVLAIECEESSGTMHTIRAANKYGTPVACYFKEGIDRPEYSGNQYMVQNYNATKIMDTEDLEKLFKQPTQKICLDDEAKQLTIEDFLNGTMKNGLGN